MRVLALALLVACGSSHGVNGDAQTGDGRGGDGRGSGDGGIDAPPTRGNVTVHVVDKTGAAKAGEHVVFVDIDSTATEMLTDAQGNATATVYEGASASVIYDLGLTPQDIITITSVTAVAPGDVIALDLDAFVQHEVPLDTTSAGTFTIGFPSYSGANHYLIYTPCGSTSTTKTSNNAITFAKGCVAATMDVLVVAENSSNAALAFVDQSGIAFASGGSATLTGTWATLPTITATYTDAAPAVQNVQLARIAPDVRGAIAPPPPTTTNADITGASTMLSIASAAPASALMQTLAWPCPNSDATCGTPGCSGTCKSMTSASQTITQVVDGTQTTYSLDVGAQLLPWIAYPYWMKATPTVLPITATGTGAVDLFEADMQYSRNNSSGNIYIWRVFAPAVGDIHFPPLPADVPGNPVPQSTDTMSVTHAYACESDAIAGYRAAVADVYAALGTCEQATQPMYTPFRGGTLHRLSQSN